MKSGLKCLILNGSCFLRLWLGNGPDHPKTDYSLLDIYNLDNFRTIFFLPLKSLSPDLKSPPNLLKIRSFKKCVCISFFVFLKATLNPFFVVLYPFLFYHCCSVKLINTLVRLSNKKNL